MLKFYVPSMNGVDEVLCESGMEPVGGVWSGNFPDLGGLPVNEITMVAGVCRKATDAEIDSRLTLNKYKRILSEPDFFAKNSGVWQVFTAEEKAAVDEAEAAADAEASAAAEAAMQANKSAALKTVENNFLLLCQALSGSKTKMTFAEMNAALTALLVSDQSQAVVLSLKLLALDAEGKREGGLNWWDTCAWHDDLP